MAEYAWWSLEHKMGLKYHEPIKIEDTDLVAAEDGLKVYAIEHGALRAAETWDVRRSAKNWLAVIAINPAAPGGFDRKFIKKAQGDFYYMVAGLEVGAPIEWGHQEYDKRRYGVIRELTDERMVVEPFHSGRAACKAVAQG